MAAILFVRLKTNLSSKELESRLLERRPFFLEIPGLIQKFYCRDEATNSASGIYIFKDRAALNAYTESDIAKSIAPAYEVTEIRKEAYDVLYPLFPDRGPLLE